MTKYLPLPASSKFSQFVASATIATTTYQLPPITKSPWQRRLQCKKTHPILKLLWHKATSKKYRLTQKEDHAAINNLTDISAIQWHHDQHPSPRSWKGTCRLLPTIFNYTCRSPQSWMRLELTQSTTSN